MSARDQTFCHAVRYNWSCIRESAINIYESVSLRRQCLCCCRHIKTNKLYPRVRVVVGQCIPFYVCHGLMSGIVVVRSNTRSSASEVWGGMLLEIYRWVVGLLKPCIFNFHLLFTNLIHGYRRTSHLFWSSGDPLFGSLIEVCRPLANKCLLLFLEVMSVRLL